MRTLIAFLVLAASVMAAELPFTQPPAFSCDFAMTGEGKKGQQGAMGGRMYNGGPDKQRMEMKTDQGGMVVITRRDTKQMIMLMEEQKMAMVMPLNESQLQYQDPTRDSKASFTKTGSETVNNVACDRYEWASGSSKGTIWIDTQQQVVVRVKPADDKTQIDFTNYQIGAQKAELFEVPAGYQNVNAGR